eukprot:COSAG01_NODE_119_length_25410_cov_1333.312275_5_plen_55_part_00
MRWVEEGVAPDRILHKISANNTRPLCPHPQVAIYSGDAKFLDKICSIACDAWLS